MRSLFNSDCWLFLVCNLRHYSRALTGFGCKLDPDYPHIKRFGFPYLHDAVLEYRTYGVLWLWGGILASVLPLTWVWLLAALWAILSFWRAGFYRSNLAFWSRAVVETPGKIRTRGRYIEQMIHDLERQYREQGRSWAEFRPQIEQIMKLMEMMK